MEKGIEKTIDVKNGKIIYQRIPNGYITFFKIIYIKFDKESKPEKKLQFSMWDDFQFDGKPKEYNQLDLEKIDFDIEKENILYGPIKRFLGDNKEFILDDDATYGINNKIMKISKNRDNIKIEFINNGKGQEEQSKLDRYKIFIKNIIFDGRSKLDDIYDNPTKERLRNLFLDLRSTIAGKEELENIIMQNQIYYLDENILFTIIPELKDCESFEHKHPHHCYDVFEHTKVAMRKSKPDLQIRLALLLHDIGKPHSYQEDGEVRHFHGHPKVSANMSREILARLGYSEKEIEDICYLIENHDTIINIDNVNENNLELIKKLLYIQYCDAYAHDPKHIEKRIKKLDEIKGKIEERIRRIQETEEER